jgi:hypothetical protein
VWVDAAPVAAAIALLLWLSLASVTLAILGTGVRAYTVFTSGPPPGSPMGMVGGVAGLGLFLAGRRLRARRGLLGWLRDPWGAAASTVVRRAIPPDHPMAALLQVAGLEPRRPPTRGAGLLALGLMLTVVAVWFAIGQWDASWGAFLLGPMLLILPWFAVLGAAVKGVLAGAWDRYLLDKMAFQTEATLGSVGRTFRGFGQPPGGFAGPRV